MSKVGLRGKQQKIQCMLPSCSSCLGTGARWPLGPITSLKPPEQTTSLQDPPCPTQQGVLQTRVQAQHWGPAQQRKAWSSVGTDPARAQRKWQVCNSSSKSMLEALCALGWFWSLKVLPEGKSHQELSEAVTRHRSHCVCPLVGPALQSHQWQSCVCSLLPGPLTQLHQDTGMVQPLSQCLVCWWPPGRRE